ncbi:SusC/RagA family TonB-linked outer membrane protein [Flavobacterium foetidum]|uniref:SusC/RagA family TonB-linked outer membrane protein n=1 Tax=Flavobacterium foetidum TaxID=2026681 RepID=UPI001074AAD8|nr:SusC/RagA family TonB-linked outer membrane protein [Flavobacterium foetidum]KAF2516631.1 SusC/RagA family TonB-linked outer membrane protein [Flavobacterium foetidum]
MKLRCKTTMFDSEKNSSFFHLSKKTIMIMRISLFHIFLLTCGTHMIFATEMSGQNLESISVDIELHNQDIKTLFKTIESRTGLLFAYQPQIIKDFPKVTTPRGRRSVSDILDIVFQGSNLDYKQVDKNVVIYKKESPKALATASGTENSEDPDYVLEGKILDENDLPLPGVTVSLVGSNKQGISDFDGRFYIHLPSGKHTLRVSYLGYKTQDLIVENKTSITIKMQPDLAKLDEIVVIGYGTTTRRTSTGSVVKITAEDIEKQPITNILQTLQGRTPGVYVTQTSGYAGSDMNISIRGRNFIDGSNLPLYIVDGVPYIGDDIKQQTQDDNVIRGAQKSTSPLNIINPNDIESIEILKDADATAIYGSRGANGVVLITTKKGKSGKTEFTITTNSGVSEVAHMIKTLDTPAYLNMLQTALDNNGDTASNFSNGIALTDWDPNAYTNWQKKLIGGTANFNNYSASLKGGNDTTNFLLSGAYHKETTVVPGNFSYDKFSTNFNINHSTLDNKLKIGASVIFATDNNKLPFFDITTYAINTAPNRPLYNADGSYYWSPDYFSDINPLAALGKRVDDKGLNLITSISLQYEIAKGFSFKTDLGYGRAQMQTKQFMPASANNHVYNEANGFDSNFSRSYTTSINNTNNFSVEPQLNYNTTLWKGNLTALVGGSWQNRKSEMPAYVYSSGYSSDNLLGNLAMAENVTANNGSTEYKYISLFSRVNYNIANKYILNLNFRRDGSSRFGANNRFGNFGSVGGAWVFSQENFMRNIPVLSFGKIRSSYGEIGSDGIGEYQYADTFDTRTYGNGNPSMTASRIANPNIKWGMTKKFEAALDLSFNNDRISFTTAYYRNTSSNQLVGYTLSPQAGFTTYTANLPAEVENKGWEFTFSTANIRTKNFNWSSSFNISFNSNKLVSFPGIEFTSYYSQYIVGKPLNSRFLHTFTGVDANGVAQFEDANGDGRISNGFAETGRGDRKYYGPAYPQYYGGLSNTISYKDFSLDFLFQFVKQDATTLMAATGTQPGYPYGTANFQVDEYNAYLAQGNALSSGYQNSYFNYLGSNAVITDASFIRLKNVSASYQIPLDEGTKKYLQGIRLSLQGQNLLTFTKYKGLDPETQGLALPPLRTITLGTQFTF